MATTITTNDKAAELLQRFSRIRNDRGVLEAHWQEVAERVMPSYSNTFNPDNFNTPGQKKTQQQFDATAAIALGRCAAIMDSLLTPRNSKWHRLLPSDSTLMRNRQASLWFEDATNILFKYRYDPKANFSSQNQQQWSSLAAFGSGVMFVDALKDTIDPSTKGLRYRNIHLGEAYFVENHQGIVDQCWRYYQMTARQAVQKFGMDVLPEGITKALVTNPEQLFYFLHVVMPRTDRDPRRLDSKGLPYACYYISKEGCKLVRETGYYSFPYAISRYSQAPGEIYGRGPAMDVLPAIKVLNEEKKTVLEQGHRTVRPVLLAFDDGIVDTMSLKPGAINSGGVTAEGRPLVHALPVGNIEIGKELMDDERMVINDAFLVNLFQILVDTPQMTATEVLERTREKGILLAPTVGRQQSEYLGPMIERELDVLVEQKLLPPMPQILVDAKGEYRVEYDSPLSRAQRAEEAAGLMRTIESTLNVVAVTQDPSPLDWFDWDEIIPDVSSINAVPMKWMKTLDAVQELREQRAQQQQMMAVGQNLPGIAAMTKAQAATQGNGK